MSERPQFTEGMRLRVVREGQPDQYVIVDEVKLKGRHEVMLTVHPEDAPRPLDFYRP